MQTVVTASRRCLRCLGLRPGAGCGGRGAGWGGAYGGRWAGGQGGSLQHTTYFSTAARYLNKENGRFTATISRMMMPDDANPLQRVHGGVVLNLIEEAGYVASTKYCNQQYPQEGSPSICGLARIDRTHFRSAILIGEHVEVTAEVTYTSPHSVQVHVEAWAEHLLKGKRRLANSATLWYVPVSLTTPHQVQVVPPMEYSSSDEEEAGRHAYLLQKQQRHLADLTYTAKPAVQGYIEPYTVGFSRLTASHIIHPSHCARHGYGRGGVMMKWMDELAGMTAIKHCQGAVVTISMDAANFHKPARIGDFVTYHTLPVFTSNKVVEVMVIAEAESMLQGKLTREKIVEALFSFVGINKDGKAQTVPTLKVTNDEEQKQFDAGLQRYRLRSTSMRATQL